MLQVGDRMRISAELIRLWHRAGGRSELVEVVRITDEADGSKTLLVQLPNDPVSLEERYAAFRAERDYVDIPARLMAWQASTETVPK